MNLLRRATLLLLTSLPGCSSAPARPEEDPSIASARAALTTTGDRDAAGLAWRPMNGTIGWGEAYAMTISRANPNVAYVGLGGAGVYETTNLIDATPTWSFVGLAGLTATQLVADRTGNVYAIATSSDPQAGSSGTLYKSPDGGRTWAETSATYATSIAIDEATPSTLYVEESDGLHKSTDGAATLPLVPGAGTGDMVAVAPSNPKVVYIRAMFGVARSTDGGATWTELPPVPSGAFSLHTALAVDPRDPLVVFVSAWSTTQGPSNYKLVSGAWQSIPSLVGSFSSLAIGPAGGTSYALPGSLSGANTANDALYTSKDGGTTWRRSLASARSTLAVKPGDPATAFVGSGAAGSQVLSRTTDGASSWRNVSGGLFATSPVTAAIAPSAPWIAYFGVPGLGVYRSPDGATTWSASPVAPGYLVGVSPKNPGRIYTADYDGIYVLADSSNGTAPVKTLTLGAVPSGIAVAPSDEKTVYVSTHGGGVLVSKDGGATWTSPLAGADAYWVAVDPVHPAVAYAGFRGNDGRLTVFKTSNSWKTWSQIDQRAFRAFAIDPVHPDTLYAATADSQTTFYGSTDGGASWSVLATLPIAGAGGSPGDPGPTFPLVIDRHVPTTLYAGLASSGVWRSSDAGRTWTQAGLDGKSPNSLVIDKRRPTTIFAAVDHGGIFKTTASGL